MRKAFIITIGLIIHLAIWAQVPQFFNYQAVLRDASGNIKSHVDATVRIDILAGSNSGPAVYSESFSASTNDFGLINLKVGNGTVISGSFSDINWEDGSFFIKVSVDGTPMGNSQLLSVPYAIYSGNGFSGNYNDLTNTPTLFDGTWNSLSGKPAFSTVAISGSYDDLTNKPTLFDGTWNSLIDKPSLTTVATSGNYDDLTNKPVILNSDRYSTAVGQSALLNQTIGNFNVAVGNQTLMNNTSGAVNTAIGTFCMGLNTTGSYNTAIGYASLLKNISGGNNTSMGSYALYWNTTGNENLACGSNTLYSNSTGSFNTAVGTNSLNANTSGYGNTAVGAHSLSKNNIGRWNTAIGDSALEKVNSDKNTAIGYKALLVCTGWDNSAIGYRAMIANTSGFDNTAVGVDALHDNTTGTGNTAIGKSAMWSNKTGENNTCIGFGTDVADGINNSMAIGYYATVGASNKVVIGNSSVTSIGGYADWTRFSDARLKENIVYDNRLGLDFILKLRTAKYNYITDENKRVQDGLIAQDVQKTLQDLGLNFSGLVVDDNADKTLNLAYGDFVIPLINAIQELNKKNQDLQQKDEALEATLNEMKTEIEILKQSIKNK